jgi:hypothetical protein
LNLEPDLNSSSGYPLNFGLNHGQVQQKFSSNFGSEPNHSITTSNVLSLKSYKISRLISVSNHPLYGSSRTNRGMNTCALSLKTPIFPLSIQHMLPFNQRILH